MAHRRLVLAFALTIAVALVALVLVTSPGHPPAFTPIATSAVESQPPMLHSPPDDLGELADGRRVWDNVGRWYAEAKRQEDEKAAAQAASAESARRTDRTGSPSAPSAPRPPAPAPVPSGDALAAIAAWFPDMYDSAVGVAHCESTLNPAAVSAGGGNWGLFQINTVHRGSFEAVTGRPWSDVLNADANAQFARWLHDSSGGWGPWACRWAA